MPDTPDFTQEARECLSDLILTALKSQSTTEKFAIKLSAAYEQGKRCREKEFAMLSVGLMRLMAAVKSGDRVQETFTSVERKWSEFYRQKAEESGEAINQLGAAVQDSGSKGGV